MQVKKREERLPSPRRASQTRLSLPLRGAGGEPVDLRRTLYSHGYLHLAPHVVDADHRALTTTVAFESGVRTIRLSEAQPGELAIDVRGPRPGARARSEILAGVRTMLALYDDLSSFYAQVANDPQLAWAAQGAGRLFRSFTAFEDVIKTILTTNCAWSATKRMNLALVQHLGEAGAFPTPNAMAEAPLSFYRDVVRAGYRGPYLRTLSKMVATGEVDLEALRSADRSKLDDEALEKQLRALPGVGPYAAAHIMLLFGRRHRLTLDSSTRPRYARLSGRKVKDSTIVRRFARYGDEAGLAFWLYLTRDWMDE